MPGISGILFFSRLNFLDGFNLLYLRRAPLGGRGAVLPLNEDMDYFFMVDPGDNGVTRDDQWQRRASRGVEQHLGLLLTLFFSHVPVQ